MTALHTRIISQMEEKRAAERFGSMLLLAPHLSVSQSLSPIDFIARHIQTMTVLSMENMQLATFFDLANFDNLYKELMIDDEATTSNSSIE